MTFTKRYLRLCPCLLFCCCWFSCAVHHRTDSAVNSVKNEETSVIWQIKVKLLPGFNNVILPVPGVQAITATYDVSGVGYQELNYSGAMILLYSFDSEEQCKQTLTQLLAMGMVRIIYVGKELY